MHLPDYLLRLLGGRPHMGAIVLDEKVYAITSISLGGGAIVVRAEGPCPVPFPSGTYGYVAFGPDGEQVVRGKEWLRGVEDVQPGDTLGITIRWTVNDKLTDSARGTDAP